MRPDARTAAGMDDAVTVTRQDERQAVASTRGHELSPNVSLTDLGLDVMHDNLYKTFSTPHMTLVHEALMFEPTETESLPTLDRYVNAVAQIRREQAEDPNLLHTTPVARVGEVYVAKTWCSSALNRRRHPSALHPARTDKASPSLRRPRPVDKDHPVLMTCVADASGVTS